MDKNDKISVKILDGTQFFVLKYHMEIVFAAKKVLHIVQGLDKRPNINQTTETLDDQEIINAWDEKHANACIFISKCIRHKFLG